VNFDSNVSGQAYALTVLTPIEPGKEADLSRYLEGLTHENSPFARLPRTHFGRWVIVPAFVNDAAQPEKEELSCQYLLFTSNFDGPLDTYLDELCDELVPEAIEIWGRCAGCPPGAAGAELKAYLLHNQIDTGFFVAAYGHATVADVRAAIAVRESMIDLAIDSQEMAPAELQRAFGERFGS
jgi:hypothetical protein